MMRRSKKEEMRTLYYYVPPCPNCGSRVTGHYVKEPRLKDDALYQERESLSHGELIRYLPREPFNNAYCEDCGYEWSQRIEGKLFSKERVTEEMRVRKTNLRYAEFMKENPKKKPSFLHKIFGFFP